MSDSSGSSESGGTSYISVSISPDPGFTLYFRRLEGTEELGRPFLYVVDLWSDKASADLTSILGGSATVSMKLGDDSKRHFNGIITRASFEGLSRGSSSYRLELRPWIWLLSQTQDCKIYQNKSAWAIISAIFQDKGFSDLTDSRQNQAGDQTLEYCVQYDETTLDFVTRLMEQWGIYYYYTHSTSSHTLVFCDDPNSHSSLGADIPFLTRGTEARSVDDHIWEWSSELNLRTGIYSMRDYNFTTPAADLTVKSTQAGTYAHGSMEVFEYPGPYETTAVGQQIAATRMQDLAARGTINRGLTNTRSMQTGKTFTFSQFADASQNAAYLITNATYTLNSAEAMSATEGELADAFRCSFETIPGSVPFKLDLATPRPVMRGPQTAKVVGKAGDEITTDLYGRIKVSFYWDRYSTQDENSSCFIRVAQIWAGVSWGAMFIPRIGQEVIVDFLDGDPDRPIITGSVYNASVTVPYALPDNATKSTIKSNSSIGGGGFNELRFEDKKDSEEVFFQAQKDYNKTVLNNETVTITQDTTTTVQKGNRSVTVSQGNDTMTVSTGTSTTTIKGDTALTVQTGNNSVTVQTGNNSLTVDTGNNSVAVKTGNDSLTVSLGNHTITVSAGSSTIEAAQSITLKVGSNSIVISTSGVTITGGTVSITGESSVSVSGGESLSLSGGTSVSISGASVAIN